VKLTQRARSEHWRGVEGEKIAKRRGAQAGKKETARDLASAGRLNAQSSLRVFSYYQKA